MNTLWIEVVSLSLSFEALGEYGLNLMKSKHGVIYCLKRAVYAFPQGEHNIQPFKFLLVPIIFPNPVSLIGYCLIWKDSSVFVSIRSWVRRFQNMIRKAFNRSKERVQNCFVGGFLVILIHFFFENSLGKGKEIMSFVGLERASRYISRVSFKTL